MENHNLEATKDTGRLAVFAAISTVVTYVLNVIFVELPVEVSGAIVLLILAGLTYVDSWIHHNKEIKSNGISPF